jgi:hypothetical protein
MALPRAPMVSPSPPRRPTYRLLIPSVQLGVLSYLISRYDPDLRVSEAYGRGSLSGESRTEDLPFGKLKFNMVGTASLDYTWSSGRRPTISEIYDSFRERGVPDISLDRLSIVRRSEVQGTPTLVELRFGKDTVHPEVYDKLVVDGAFPKEETALFVTRLKESLSSTVSHEVLKRVRYSCLILHRILPHSDLIYDASVVYSLCNASYMRIIKEIYRRWELYDYEYLPRAQP